VKIPRVSIRLSAVLAVLSVSAAAAMFPAAPAMAQGAPNAQNIAVIDIGKVVMGVEKYKQEMNSFHAEVVATGKEFQQMKKDLETLQAQQKQLAPDTPDYKRLDDQIMRGSADLNFRNTQKKKDFAEREGKMVFNFYREIQDAVKQFSQQYNIALVIQYDSTEVSPNNPQSALGRSVVYVNHGLDITPDIINSLNRSANQAVRPSPIGVNPH
jgi:Skp family chaperone for outer membrane proteins